MEFGYWNIKGIAEPIRYLLAHLGIAYKEANPINREQWLAYKNDLDLDFPNLPYLIDKDIKLTESDAIAMYLCHKAGSQDLFGKQGLDSIKHRMILDVVKDLRKSLFETAKSDNYKEKFEERSKGDFRRKLSYLQRYLNQNEFLLGYLTYSDFYLFYDCNILDAMSKGIKTNNPLDEFEFLQKHQQRMREVNGLKDYVDNDLRMFFPYLSAKSTKFDLSD